MSLTARAAGSALLAIGFACGGCAAAQPLFAPIALPAEGQGALTALARPPILTPARYRAVVVPGSGCGGMAPIADRYFAGLQHAEVLVLHKPGVDVNAWPAPAQCPAAFVLQDNLADWLASARAAIRRYWLDHPSPLPLLLVGISEGAELLPALSADLPEASGLVVVSNAGLDPAEVLSLQAERQGAARAWRAIVAAAASARPDSAMIEGRSLLYWRVLLTWPVKDRLLALPLPLLHAWGSDDARIPLPAYERFRQLAVARATPYCAMPFAAADHGLQSPAGDQLPRVWQVLEDWARDGRWCGQDTRPALPNGAAAPPGVPQAR